MPVFYGAVDLSKNELRNAVVQNLGSPPAGQGGQLYYDTTAHILYWHNGTTWVSASGASPATTVTNSAVGDAQVVGTSLFYARQDHTHGREAFGAVVTETSFGQAAANGSAATVSHSDHTHGTPAAPAGVTPASSVTSETVGTASAVGSSLNYARQDHAHGWVAAIAPLDMNGFQINNLLAPTTSSDAASKGYVDNLVNGLEWKAPVRAYGTANIALTGIPSNTLTDGVTLVAGDRVLLNNQSTPSQNGIYVVASGAWSRATDNDAANEMVNATVYISEGTTYADTQWTCTTNAPITIGTTSILFQQIAGAGTYTWGNGLTNVGNTVNVNPGNGIQIISDAVAVLAADTSINVTGGGIQVNAAVVALKSDLTSYAPTSRLINTTAPITGGGNLTADRTIGIATFAGSSPGAVPTSPGGGTTFLRADGAWASPPGSGLSKFAAALNGTASPEVITHNLNTRDIQLTVLNGASPYTAVEVDWDATTVNTATIRYNPVLGAGYRVVIVG